jgi:predicted HicB family RNase H-like nuclease
MAASLLGCQRGCSANRRAGSRKCNQSATMNPKVPLMVRLPADVHAALKAAAAANDNSLNREIVRRLRDSFGYRR